MLLKGNQTGEPTAFCRRWGTRPQNQPMLPAETTVFYSVFKGRTHPSTCWLPKSIIPLSTLFKQPVPNQKWMTASAWVMHSCTVCVSKYVYDVSQMLSLLWGWYMSLWWICCVSTYLQGFCVVAAVLLWSSWESVSVWLVLIMFSKCWAPVVFAQMRKAVRVVFQMWQCWESQWWMTRN